LSKIFKVFYDISSIDFDSDDAYFVWKRSAIKPKGVTFLDEVIDEFSIEIRSMVLKEIKEVGIFISNVVTQSFFGYSESWQKSWAVSHFSELANLEKSQTFSMLAQVTAIELFAKKNVSIILIGFPTLLRDSLTKLIDRKLTVRKLSFFNKNLWVFTKSLIFFSRMLLSSMINSLIVKRIPHDTYGLIFIDYLYQFDDQRKHDAKFLRYWGELPDLITSQRLPPTLWIHKFVKSSETPDLKTARSVVKGFNSVCAKRNQVHVLLEDYLRPINAIRSFIEFIKIVQLILRLERKLLLSGKTVTWVMNTFEWRRSFFSAELFSHLADGAAIRNLLHGRSGSKSTLVYVYENQPWEYLANEEAAKCGISRSIASVQGSIRFWDLRYAVTPRRVHDCGGEKVFMPAVLASNGQDATNKLEKSNSLKFLKPVESYRMSSLRGNVDPSLSDWKILVVGEYSEKMTKRLIDIVNEAVETVELDVEVCLLPHPATKKSFEEELKQLLTLTMIREMDSRTIVLADANSSFVLEAIFSGSPVICFIDDDNLNFSPLYKENGILFTRNSDEMSAEIRSIINGGYHGFEGAEDFFYSSYGSNNWTTLLNGDS